MTRSYQNCLDAVQLGNLQKEENSAQYDSTLVHSHMIVPSTYILFWSSWIEFLHKVGIIGIFEL